MQILYSILIHTLRKYIILGHKITQQDLGHIHIADLEGTTSTIFESVLSLLSYSLGLIKKAKLPLTLLRAAGAIAAVETELE